MHLFRRVFPVLFALGGCAGARTLPPGTYLQMRPNTVLLTSRELTVYPDGQIRYQLHTDDLSMSRESQGRYRRRGRHLELQLNGQPDTTTARTSYTPLPATDRRLRFFVSTTAETGQPEPVQGLTVLVRNAAGQPINGAATDSDGYAELTWGAATAPQTVEITGIGWQRWQRPWPAEPATFRVQLRPQPYEAYAAGTRKTFTVLAASPERLVLLQGADTLTLVRQP